MKWADYLISAVGYKQVNFKKYIAKCMVHSDTGESVGQGSIWTREEILKSIDNKSTFMTIYKNDEKWSKGSEVHKIEVKNNYYLKTDPNSKEEDNLENLPEF